MIRKHNMLTTQKSCSPPSAVLNSLLAHYQHQHFIEAEQLAREIIDEFPKHPFSWKVLSALLGQTGRTAEALNANQEAVKLSPNDYEAINNLGITQKKLNMLDEAESSYRKAIALKSDYAEAHNNLGITLHAKGKTGNAKSSYLRAIKINPKYVEAYNNLAITQKALGRLEEAEKSYRKAISLKPTYAEAHNNLGNILTKLNLHVEAEASYRDAIQYRSNFSEAFNNLGLSLQEQGRSEEAIESFIQAINLKSNYAEAFNNLGVTIKEVGRLDEAKSCFDRALSIQPDFAEAQSNLGSTLKTMGEFNDAEENFRQALKIKPDALKIRTNLGILLYEQGNIVEASKFLEESNDLHSKSFLLKCLYDQDDQKRFFTLLDSLISDGRINPTLGSLTARSEIKYGIKKQNLFVSEPFKHVVRRDLNQRCNFAEIFVQPVKQILNNENYSRKSQGLLTKGEQTAGNFFSTKASSIQKIESIIRLEIEQYKNQFLGSQEGFLKYWPVNFKLNGWLVNMKSGGKLAPHMHEDGWISGAVYVNVPPKKTPDSGNFVVCINNEIPDEHDTSQRRDIVDVETGSLVLFPSSLMHYTIPFNSDENRIVLAFDVNPC